MPLGRTDDDAGRFRMVVLCALAALAVSLCVFSPRLWVMRDVAPGSFQWARAQTFLAQCEDPFRRDVEPATLWRLLPPLVAHTLGLRGKTPLVIPWLGIIAATGYVALLCRRRSPDWRFVFGGTSLFATSAAVLAPAHWLGLNDAWAWLGLLAIAFGRSRWAIPLACLLAPWVDERFVIGLPLALIVRAVDLGESTGVTLLRHALWLLPYAIVRLAFSFDPLVAEPTRGFIASHLHQSVIIAPWAPLGWWMAWRAAWLPAIYACRRGRLLLGFAAAVTLGVALLLAADLSRSAALLAPLVLLGIFEYTRNFPTVAARHVLILAAANLLIPAAHVTYTKFDLINPLPIEVIRLIRISSQ